MFVSAQWSRTSLFVSLKQVSNPLKGYPLSVDCRTVDLAAVGASTGPQLRGFRCVAASGASRLTVAYRSAPFGVNQSTKWALDRSRRQRPGGQLNGDWTESGGRNEIDRNRGTVRRRFGRSARPRNACHVRWGDHCRRRAARQRAGRAAMGESQSGRHCAKAMVEGTGFQDSTEPSACGRRTETGCASCSGHTGAVDSGAERVPSRIAGAEPVPHSSASGRFRSRLGHTGPQAGCCSRCGHTVALAGCCSRCGHTVARASCCSPCGHTGAWAACCSRCAAARGGGTCACARIGPSASGACGYRTATDPARPRAKRARGRDRGKAVGTPRVGNAASRPESV